MLCTNTKHKDQQKTHLHQGSGFQVTLMDAKKYCKREIVEECTIHSSILYIEVYYTYSYTFFISYLYAVFFSGSGLGLIYFLG